MLNRLAWRNVKRSARDYLVFFLTMTMVTALMFAFNSLIFSGDMLKMFEMAELMGIMVGLATFFIVLIVAWLINYMVRFMLEKRSREFGIYMLIGMKKKQIARLYMRENVLLGFFAFLLGLIFGVFLQQILMTIFYHLLHFDYHIRLEFNGYCMLMTIGCYGGCYLLALLRNHRKFRKMNIYDLMNAQKQNEQIKEKHEKTKQWLLPASLLVFVGFGFFLFKGVWNGLIILLFTIGIVLAVYVFYTGLSACIISYIRRKGDLIYKNQNLFLLRQLSSKIKTMSFTMGTLTSLFTIALLGCTIAFMFNDFQTKMLADKFPFDAILYSSNVEDNFQKERDVIEQSAPVKNELIYQIYTNQTSDANEWLYTHLTVFGDSYKKEDGSPNLKKIKKEGYQYCKYDTYMKLSDYNALRKMLGYDELFMSENEYAIQIKKRIKQEAENLDKQLSVTGINGPLTFSGYYSENFSQDGHNGGDYLIIVPDSVIETMQPYYSLMAVDLKGKTPDNLQAKLDKLDEQSGGETDFAGHSMMGENSCSGSDTIVVYSSKILVRDNLIPEVKFLLASIIFPLFYIGFVFVGIALTVLSVQQLSDSAKYKFRYHVLKKIGYSKKEVSHVIRQQLLLYYLCPIFVAVILSGIFSVYMSSRFIFYAGISTPSFQYFGISLLLFAGIYLLYYITTYIGFVRNVNSDNLMEE